MDHPMGQGTPAPLRLVVMGTGPFAVPMLEALARSPHSIVAVITRPDRTAPGRRPPPNPVRTAAVAAGLPIYDPPLINAPDAVALLEGLRPDLLVVCDYGQILAPLALGVAPLGGINLHGSLLPRHRGAAPVQWAILEGDSVGGVSVIHMTPALDAGAVIVAREVAIGTAETSPELEARLAKVGVGATLEAIDCLTKTLRGGGGGQVGIPQEARLVTRAPRLTKADGVVAWTLPSDRLERMRRALEPWPRLTTFLPGSGAQPPLRIVLADVAVAPPGPTSPGVAPGTVLAADDAGIVVACGEGTALVIRQLVPEGRRPMTAADFLRGHRLVPGLRLG